MSVAALKQCGSAFASWWPVINRGGVWVIIAMLEHLTGWMDKQYWAVVSSMTPGELAWVLAREGCGMLLAGGIVYRTYIDTSFGRHLEDRKAAGGGTRFFGKVNTGP